MDYSNIRDYVYDEDADTWHDPEDLVNELNEVDLGEELLGYVTQDEILNALTEDEEKPGVFVNLDFQFGDELVTVQAEGSSPKLVVAALYKIRELDLEAVYGELVSL